MLHPLPASQNSSWEPAALQNSTGIDCCDGVWRRIEVPGHPKLWDSCCSARIHPSRIAPGSAGAPWRANGSWCLWSPPSHAPLPTLRHRAAQQFPCGLQGDLPVCARCCQDPWGAGHGAVPAWISVGASFAAVDGHSAAGAAAVMHGAWCMQSMHPRLHFAYGCI